MNLFPRSVKEKHGVAAPLSDNKLVVHNNNNSVSASRNATSLLHSSSKSPQRAIDTSVPAVTKTYQPDPNRKVHLTTINRQNPLLRHTRELLHRSNGGRSPEDASVEVVKRHDEDREAIAACAPYTESFNHLLRQMGKRNKQSVQLVMDRMRNEQIPMDATTYNLLLSKVVDLKDDIAFRIYDDFREESQREDASLRPDLQTFHYMMRACERCAYYDRAFQLHTQMKELLGLYPDVSMYNTLIGFCAPIHDEAQASYLVEEMKDRGTDPDVHTYNCLMNVFADAPYEIILQTFEDMIKRRIKPNLRSFNTLMKACLRMWDYDRAFQYFEELKREGLIPDVITYNVLLVMCKERLDFVFGTGMHANLRRTKEQRESGMKAVAELSMSLFAEMEELDVLPNTFTYNALIGVLGRCEDFRVMDVFGHMKTDRRWESRQEKDQEDPHATWIAENFAARGMPVPPAPPAIPQVPEVSSDASLSGRGVQPNLETFRLMIDAACRMRLGKMAFMFFKEMKEQYHLKPNKEVYLLMMRVCSLENQKAEALHVFNEAHQTGFMDVDIYNARMDVLAIACDQELFTLFERLKKDSDRLSLRPSEGSYNVALGGCLRMRQVQQAFDIYAEMCQPGAPVPPNTATYALLIDISALVKDTKTASNLVLEMKQRHVPITVDTYCRLLNCYVAADDEGVVGLFQEMKRQGPQPNLDAYIVLLQYYKKKKSATILQVFDEMKVGPVEPDLECYNVVLWYCAMIESDRKSMKYFEELKTRGLNADVDTYNALIAVFAPTGNEFLYRIFEEMQELKIPPNHETFSILMMHQEGRRVLSHAREQGLIYVEPTAPQIK